MLFHHIRPTMAVADTLPRRFSSVAPGKEGGSRTEFASDRDAADIHVHAYASTRTNGRTGVQRGAKRPATVHGN